MTLVSFLLRNSHKLDCQEDIVKEYKKGDSHKRFRTRLTGEQIKLLESTYEKTPYITENVRVELALRLDLTSQTIKVWFQNRRRRLKFQFKHQFDSLAVPKSIKIEKTESDDTDTNSNPIIGSFRPHVALFSNLQNSNINQIISKNFNDLEDEKIKPLFFSTDSLLSPSEQFPLLASILSSSMMDNKKRCKESLNMSPIIITPINTSGSEAPLDFSTKISVKRECISPILNDQLYQNRDASMYESPIDFSSSRSPSNDAPLEECGSYFSNSSPYSNNSSHEDSTDVKGSSSMITDEYTDSFDEPVDLSSNKSATLYRMISDEPLSLVCKKSP